MTQDTDGWFLEGVLQTGKTWVIPIDPLPFRIGRGGDCHLTLTTARASRRHAELFEREGALMIRDLASTNGTYVNRRRIEDETSLGEGDVVHIGHAEFRIGIQEESDPLTETRMELDEALPRRFALDETDFEKMMEREEVFPVFQPILRLSDERVLAYEMMGRGASDVLPEAPIELFGIAETLERDIELSRLFRKHGIRRGADLPGSPTLFLNVYPSETFQAQLIDSLRDIRTSWPHLSLVVEINEKAVTEIDKMRSLRGALKELRIGLAYDDFGAGQARLLELVEVPPDILKFDISLVRGLTITVSRSLRLVKTLLKMTRDLGIRSVAEGIETYREAETCRRLGFDYGQGFYFGKPLPVEAILSKTEAGSPWSPPLLNPQEGGSR